MKFSPSGCRALEAPPMLKFYAIRVETPCRGGCVLISVLVNRSLFPRWALQRGSRWGVSCGVFGGGGLHLYFLRKIWNAGRGVCGNIAERGERVRHPSLFPIDRNRKLSNAPGGLKFPVPRKGFFWVERNRSPRFKNKRTHSTPRESTPSL